MTILGHIIMREKQTAVNEADIKHMIDFLFSEIYEKDVYGDRDEISRHVGSIKLEDQSVCISSPGDDQFDMIFNALSNNLVDSVEEKVTFSHLDMEEIHRRNDYAVYAITQGKNPANS